MDFVAVRRKQFWPLPLALQWTNGSLAKALKPTNGRTKDMAKGQSRREGETVKCVLEDER